MNYEPKAPRGEDELGTFFVDDVLERLNGKFHERMGLFGIKKGTKKFKTLQAEFFMGAVMLNELYHSEEGRSAVPPVVYFGIIRGDIDSMIKPK